MSKKYTRRPDLIECVSLRSTYAVCYTMRADGLPPSRNSSLPVSSVPNPFMEAKSRQRLANMLNWMVLFSDKKRVYDKSTGKTFSFLVNFCTLTLPPPQLHDDFYVKQHLLMPFLKWLRRNCAVSYVWKAEVNSHNTLHFHITLNHFIHWKSIRSKWNRLLAAHGYCKVFQDGSNDRGNAATQIKAVINEKSIGGYLAGYITKKDRTKLKLKTPRGLPNVFECAECSDTASNYDYSPGSPLKRPVEGRKWGTSYNLSRVHVTLSDALQSAGGDSIRLLVEQSQVKHYDYWTVYLFKRNLRWLKKTPHLQGLLDEAKEAFYKEAPPQLFFSVPSLN